MKLRLTESDLRKIISTTVGKILKEGAENNEILSRIIERLSNVDVSSNIGSNDIEVPLDEVGNQIAFITYEIEEGRYLTPGMPGADRDVQDDYPNVEGDFEVYVTEIVVENVTLLDSKKGSTINLPEPPKQEEEKLDPYTAFGDSIEANEEQQELPFDESSLPF